MLLFSRVNISFFLFPNPSFVHQVWKHRTMISSVYRIYYLFPYTSGQFTTPNVIIISGSAVALLASLATSISFIYLWVHHKQKANRVSLRCVALASGANVIQGVLDIVQNDTGFKKVERLSCSRHYFEIRRRSLLGLFGHCWRQPRRCLCIQSEACRSVYAYLSSCSAWVQSDIYNRVHLRRSDHARQRKRGH